MDRLLGRLAVSRDLIDLEQLNEATRAQSRRGDDSKLGQILVELGYLDFEQLNLLLGAQLKYIQSNDERLATGPFHLAMKQRYGAPLVIEESPRPNTAPPASEPAIPEDATMPPSSTNTRWIRPSGLFFDSPLETALREGRSLGASDLHVHCGSPFQLRLHGKLVRYGETALAPEVVEKGLLNLLDPGARERFDDKGQVDFIFDLHGVGRYRASVYRQLGGIDGVFRIIPEKPPSLQELGLPAELARLTNFDQGLILLTGPARCGKTTTMASLVHILNEERAGHILTIEDPIEFKHSGARSIITQRQVGLHSASFSRAAQAALREDPDVLVLGELEDTESVELALQAAATGHLVLATMRTRGAVQTLEHLLAGFPASEQSHARALLADALRAVVTQRLVRVRSDDGMMVAYGVLVCTTAVGNLIRDDKIFQIPNLMQMDERSGNLHLDEHLARLVRRGDITLTEGRRHALDPARFGGEH